MTALVIVSNPRDLAFQIVESRGAFGWVIYQGPIRNRRLLLEYAPVLASREQALAKLREILAVCHSVVIAEIDDPATLVGGYLNPNQRSVEQLEVFDESCLAEVMNRLASCDLVETYPTANHS